MVIIIYLLKIATSIPLAFVANGSETRASVYLIDWPALSYECHQIFLFNLKIECVDIINVVFLKKIINSTYINKIY